MDRMKKFVRMLDARLRRRVEQAAEQIIQGNLERLDIKPMKGYDRLFRCRIGSVRITFQRLDNGRNILLDAAFCGSAYKK
ncbi:hypothetical protein HZA87_02350 [Candidatus Uhrbacteria bacterium]|nr:hypothetical protein [Candidatus Uhrbacteria bacterium]